MKNNKFISSTNQLTDNGISSSRSIGNNLQTSDISPKRILLTDNLTILKPKNSLSKDNLSKEDSRSTKRIFTYSATENTKILKKIFKIL